MNKILLATAILAFSSGALADAVSDTNGKFELFGGSVDGTHTENASASIALPLSEKYGFQADILSGQIGKEDINGFGLHLFMRDPSKYLFGVTASYAEQGDTSLERVGFEGEFYTSNFTFAATTGYQGGDVGSDSYTTADVHYYINDNLVVTAGGSIADKDDRWGISIEGQTSVSGLSVYAASYSGNYAFDSTTVGVRYYWGAKKSLKLRHREDDPANTLFNTISGSSNTINSTATIVCSGKETILVNGECVQPIQS